MNEDFQDMLAALLRIIRNKRATGRLQDLADVEKLEEENG